MARERGCRQAEGRAIQSDKFVLDLEPGQAKVISQTIRWQNTEPGSRQQQHDSLMRLQASRPIEVGYFFSSTIVNSLTSMVRGASFSVGIVTMPLTLAVLPAASLASFWP